MNEHQDAIFRAVQKLFALFERGNDLERAGAYARALVRLPIERLERAISWAEQTWEEKSPPPVPWLLKAAWKDAPPPTDKPTLRAEEEAERERLKFLRYYAERFSMADWYVFKHAFGFAVSAQLYARLGIPVPEGVTFVAPDAAWCRAERERSQLAAREAFHRLGARHKAAVPMPEQMAKAVQEAIEKTAQQDVPF